VCFWGRSGCVTLLMVAAVAIAVQDRAANAQAGNEQRKPEYVGSQKCQSCHASIFKTYSSTMMGRTSGPAASALIPGSFVHKPSSMAYRVWTEGGKAYMSFERTDDPSVHGRQELEYYVGSGNHGRAYLYHVDGYLFQSPINYYSDPAHWDMSPGYQGVREMPFNHAVDRTCLFCHTSQVAPPVAGTENRYPQPPFAEHGVSCERCHGPGSLHVARQGSMFNPARSSPEARDAVCAQCHLEGDATVLKRGKDLYDFRPGERLTDYMSVFLVRSASTGQVPHASSHFESLATSKCKIKSGDNMSCLSCHDPHREPSAEQRVAYYRGKCLTCHVGAKYAERHHPEAKDCTSCHMPRMRSHDVGHAMLTDHRIPIRPIAADTETRPEARTIEAWGEQGDDPRSRGLAYAQLAEVNPEYAGEAVRLLQRAVKQGANDDEALTRLAFLYQRQGNVTGAEELYSKALAANPNQRVAAANLGVIFAQSGRLKDAVALWSRLFEYNPQLSEVGSNLAVAQCALGQKTEAQKCLAEVLHFNPDYRRARQLAAALERGDVPCGQ
jgi:hypothetical protein